MRSRFYRESHNVGRIGWLRAAVLGANDGTISVASLVVGVAAAGAPQGSILLTGVAGLVAGAMSMAAGEYVSVQSQADTEKADIKKEKIELENAPESELAELTAIDVKKGLDQQQSDEKVSQTAATERFRADKEAQAALAHTKILRDILANDYDALFYPGGHGPLWDLAEDRISFSLIETMYAQGKPVSAVCHAPGVFRHAKSPDGSPLVHGKFVTGFSNSEEKAVGLTDVVPFLVEDELRKKGGIYSKGADWQSYFVHDGNLITGQNPASSEAVAKAVLELL